MDLSPSDTLDSTSSSISSLLAYEGEAAQRPTQTLTPREQLDYQTARTSPSDSSQQETWVDFLRAGEHSTLAGPTAHSQPRPSNAPPAYLDALFVSQPRVPGQPRRHTMADRKRRLTQPKSPGRRNGPLQSEGGDSQQQAGPSNAVAAHAPGSSVAGAIQLTGLATTPSRESPPVPPQDRRPSEFVLPRWQPDSEVTHCPVCQNQFTFFYRKHHCRKCGRVVCSNCSPHRITIPRQFIVRPPDPPSAIIDLTGSDGDSSPISPRNFWGGEEVRVCNPCVPDPNLSPPPQHHSTSTSPAHWRYLENIHLPPPPNRHRNSTGPYPPPHPPSSRLGHRSTLSDAALLAAGAHRGHPQDPFRHAAQFVNPTSVRDLWPPTAPPGQPPLYPPRLSSASGSGISPRQSPFPYRSMLDVSASISSATPPPPPPPRRQIAEEDECPICGSELPPKGPNGETTEREGHVEDCIQSHLYTGTPPPRVTSAPLEAAEGAASASTSAPSAASSSLPANSLSSASGSGPLRQRRMTGGRMLVYRATEKDCLGEDQEPQECVICFEEFDEGDEMGRLECLCKFHRSCIRQWWDTKGVGSCPTHQLHD